MCCRPRHAAGSLAFGCPDSGCQQPRAAFASILIHRRGGGSWRDDEHISCVCLQASRAARGQDARQPTTFSQWLLEAAQHLRPACCWRRGCCHSARAAAGRHGWLTAAQPQAGCPGWPCPGCVAPTGAARGQDAAAAAQLGPCCAASRQRAAQAGALSEPGRRFWGNHLWDSRCSWPAGCASSARAGVRWQSGHDDVHWRWGDQPCAQRCGG